MNVSNEVFIALITGGSALIGGLVASIPNFLQQYKEHKRWSIEKKIEYLNQEIEKIEHNKRTVLKDLHNLLYEKKFEKNTDLFSSVPQEVFDVYKRHFPDGTTYISSLTKEKKDQIFMDVGTAMEKKIIEIRKSMKKLLS